MLPAWEAQVTVATPPDIRMEVIGKLAPPPPGTLFVTLATAQL